MNPRSAAAPLADAAVARGLARGAGWGVNWSSFASASKQVVVAAAVVVAVAGTNERGCCRGCQ